MRGEGIISPSYYQSCIKAPSSGIPQQSTAQFPQLFYSDSCRRSSSWTGLVWWLSSSVSEDWSPSRCISSFHFHQPTSFSTSSASCLHLTLSITTMINVFTFRTLSIVIDHPDHISWSSHSLHLTISTFITRVIQSSWSSQSLHLTFSKLHSAKLFTAVPNKQFLQLN